MTGGVQGGGGYPSMEIIILPDLFPWHSRFKNILFCPNLLFYWLIVCGYKKSANMRAGLVCKSLSHLTIPNCWLQKHVNVWGVHMPKNIVISAKFLKSLAYSRRNLRTFQKKYLFQWFVPHQTSIKCYHHTSCRLENCSP